MGLKLNWSELVKIVTVSWKNNPVLKFLYYAIEYNKYDFIYLLSAVFLAQRLVGPSK